MDPLPVEMFPLVDVVRTEVLPSKLSECLEQSGADDGLMSLAEMLYAACADHPPNRKDAVRFITAMASCKGVFIVKALEVLAPEWMRKNPGKKPGLDRFGKWAFVELRTPVSNCILSLYLAATARAFPRLASHFQIATPLAKMVYEHNWNPLQPTSQSK